MSVFMILLVIRSADKRLFNQYHIDGPGGLNVCIDKKVAAMAL